MKLSVLILTLLLTMTLILILSSDAEADPPDSIQVSYNYEEEILSVTIDHEGGGGHYIDKVEITINQESPIVHTYTSQPGTNPFTYEYSITAEDGDNLKAQAYCNEGGDRPASMKVEHTDQPLDLSLSPPTTIIDENTSTEFTLHVESGGEPIEGASLDIRADLGGISDVAESGSGDYTFNFLSPQVDSDVTDGINITASKRGYITTDLDVAITIHNVLENASKVNITVLPITDSMEEATDTGFTVSVETEGSPLEGAAMTVDPVYGSVDGILEIGGGDYGFSYTAPQVNGDVEELLTIGISKVGYETAYLIMNYTITNGPDTEHKICIFMTPDTDLIEGGDTVNFTLTLEAGCEPVTDVSVVVGRDFGAVTNVVDNDDGTYDFTYLAPEDKEGEMEVIAISVSKEGYRDNVKEFNFTIYHPKPPIEPSDLDGIISDGEYDFMTSFGGGDLEVHWTIEGDTITFAWLGKTSGWVSLGLDPGKAMEDADMILAWVDDQGMVHVIDAYSEGPTGPHPPDTEIGGTDDILEYAGTEKDGITIIEFRRKLSTGDQYDKDIPTEGKLKVIWSNGPSDDFYAIHEGSQVGTGFINFVSGESEEEDDVELWPVHALFMTIGLLSMLTAIYIAMFRRKEKWWMKYHRKLGIIGSASTITGLILGFYMVEEATGEHWRVDHSVIGLLTILLAAATPTIGLLMFTYKKQIKTMKMVHRWLGRVTLLLMLLTVLSGLSAAGVI